jgi:hypothetical protein
MMDEKIYDDLMDAFTDSLLCDKLRHAHVENILKRIAIDARREVLEEAAEIAFKEWSKCAKLPRIGIFAYTKRIIDAISSLEGK